MIDLIANILNKILSLLPTDPLANYLSSLSLSLVNANWIKWLNWFFPIHQIYVIFSLWLTAVIIYKVIRIFMSGFSSFKGEI